MIKTYCLKNKINSLNNYIENQSHIGYELPCDVKVHNLYGFDFLYMAKSQVISNSSYSYIII